jgi:hypothetical protein
MNHAYCRWTQYNSTLTLWSDDIFQSWTPILLEDQIPNQSSRAPSQIGFSAREKKCIQELGGKLADLFSDPAFVVGRYVDAESLRRLLSKPILTDDEASLIFRILNLELWYREFASHRSNL